VEPERLDTATVRNRRVENDRMDPVVVDAVTEEISAVLPKSVENTNEFIFIVETVTVEPLSVLPINVEPIRFVTLNVEPSRVEKTVRPFVIRVLPTSVENPANPAFILDVMTVDNVAVLPAIVENPSGLVYNVEPIADDKKPVLA
jgi:hypothetical protein